jgi:4'-phosphopantetheinyl transferase
MSQSKQKERKLVSDAVHIWQVSTDQSPSIVEYYRGFLSEDEKEQAARFRFPEHRRRFILTHAVLRDILAGCLSVKNEKVEPGDILFRIGTFGKPEICGIGGPRYQTNDNRRSVDLPIKGVHFNTSSTQDLAIIAVTKNRQVGVDVEWIRPVSEMDEIISTRFSNFESSWLLTLPPEKRVVAFFECWCRKEAYLKAIGVGFSKPLNGFSVVSGSGEYLKFIDGETASPEAKRWRIATIDIGQQHCAALAVENDFQKIETFKWQFKDR